MSKFFTAIQIVSLLLIVLLSLSQVPIFDNEYGGMFSGLLSGLILLAAIVVFTVIALSRFMYRLFKYKLTIKQDWRKLFKLSQSEFRIIRIGIIILVVFIVLMGVY
jgi:uncharacterized membrane protein YbhN (UPF0104 family)